MGYKRIIIFSVVMLVMGIGSLIIGLHQEASVSVPTSSPQVLGQMTASSSAVMKARVSRVIDGDTFAIEQNGQEEKVRYIGIDTPETVDPHRPVGCFGHEASDEDKSLIEGKEVEMVADREDKDKFGRLLRYVYLKLDSGQYLFVNDYLVREGFAKLDTIAPNTTYSSEFAIAQQEAQLYKRGLWQKCS